MLTLVLLLLKGNPLAIRPPRTHNLFGERIGPPRIRCPLCAWEPGRDDRWRCVCDFVWHTFDTFGVCPSCEHRWLETMCLRCHEWSRHRDWYGDDEPPSR